MTCPKSQGKALSAQFTLWAALLLGFQNCAGGFSTTAHEATPRSPSAFFALSQSNVSSAGSNSAAGAASGVAIPQGQSFVVTADLSAYSVGTTALWDHAYIDGFNFCESTTRADATQTVFNCASSGVVSVTLHLTLIDGSTETHQISVTVGDSTVSPIASTQPNPNDPPMADAVRGATLFANNCLSCHHHQALPNSDLSGQSLTETLIAGRISSVVAMNATASLHQLTPSDLDDIAAALR